MNLTQISYFITRDTELQMECTCKVFEMFLHVVWAWGAHEKVFHERLGFTKRSGTIIHETLNIKNENK
jgi:hypothetical protein